MQLYEPQNNPEPTHKKVAGGRSGISAFQMDIKVEGITLDIMRKAIAQAGAGRAHILDQMAKCSPAPRGELSTHAPVINMMRIDRSKIGALIGPVRGGSKGLTISTLLGVADGVV